MSLFSFVQKDNVANQREHLILLLASAHSRMVQLSDQQNRTDVNTVFGVNSTNNST